MLLGEPGKSSKQVRQEVQQNQQGKVTKEEQPDAAELGHGKRKRCSIEETPHKRRDKISLREMKGLMKMTGYMRSRR